MNRKSKTSVSIIGGSDGPTSVYIAGRTGKKTLRARIRNYIYKFRRKKAEKQVVAGTHTLEEVVAYARDKYGAIEVDTSQRRYIEQQRCLEMSLMIKHTPELLDDAIAKISDNEIAMNFHIYEIKVDDGCMELEMDYIWDIFEVSYSGSKKVVNQLKRIAQDLYLYYGVTEEDIKNKSERYSSLLSILSV